MGDGAWDLISSLWPSAEAALEEEAVLEPTVYAWRVAPPPSHSPRTPPSGGGDGSGSGGGGGGDGGRAAHRAGGGVSGNFGLPHRDYSYNESFTGDRNGKRSVVCAWLPLTPATTESGCLHMLPKEHDRFVTKCYEVLSNVT